MSMSTSIMPPSSGGSSGSSPLARQNVPRRVLDKKDVDDLNTITTFLSSPTTPLSEISSSSQDHNEGGVETVYVLAGSAILPLAEALYNHLVSLLYPHAHAHGHDHDHDRDTNIDTAGAEVGDGSQGEGSGLVRLIIAGGIGHSTALLYDAISVHPVYHSLNDHMTIRGSSESRILRGMLMYYWPALSKAVEDGRLILELDERSTNCGANAIEAKMIMDKLGIRIRRVVVVQDPTMHRRTLAGFEKIYIEEDSITYSQHPSRPQGELRREGGIPTQTRQQRIPELVGWTFTPRLSFSHNRDDECDGERNRDPEPSVQWAITDLSLPSPIQSRVTDGELWSMDRYISLVLGEIPRLRDDEEGYGPLGKGFITHVDIPEEVEVAWKRLSAVTSASASASTSVATSSR